MRILTSLILTLLLLPTALNAAPPEIIHHQGRVTSGGVNFDGAGSFRFALVDQAGTTTYWSNDGTSVAGSQPAAAVPLTVSGGLYSLGLGDTALTGMTAFIPASVFADNSEVYLRIWFDDGTNGSQQLSPDQRLTSVGYAHTTSSVEGLALDASNFSFAFGENTTASGLRAGAWGDTTTGSGNNSTAFGTNTNATAIRATAWGNLTTASANNATAFGANSTASNDRATAWGDTTTASGSNSTAWGTSTEARRAGSTAWGNATVAGGTTAGIGDLATAWGQSTSALRDLATSWGDSTTAGGQNSTAFGDNTNAESFLETALGRFDTDYTPASTSGWNPTDRLFVIGNGANAGSRNDALVILKNGNTTVDGDLTINGTLNATISGGSLPSNLMTEGENVSLLINDAGYLTSVAGQNISQLTNDSGYLTSIAGQNISQLTNDSSYLTTVTSSDITNGTIVNADISGSADIASSKLASSVVTSGENISQLTNDSGYLTSVDGSTIINGTITNEDISASAAIASSKLASNVLTSGDNISQLNNNAGYLISVVSTLIRPDTDAVHGLGSSGFRWSRLHLGDTGIWLGNTGGTPAHLHFASGNLKVDDAPLRVTEDIVTQSEFKYTSTRSDDLSIPAPAFNVASDTAEYNRGASGFIRPSGNSTTIVFVAPVYLPEGATVKSMATKFYDNSTENIIDIDAYLYRRTFNTTNTVEMAAIVNENLGGMSTSVITFSDTTVTNAVIDHSYFYFIRVVMTVSDTDVGLRFYGAQIHYWYDTLNY